jgi:hypothetical protein
MIDLNLEQRVRAAARASIDAVTVPELPASLRLMRAGVARRRTREWLWAAAVAAAVTLTIATDGGRAAIAYAVEHTVHVFSVDPDGGKRVEASTISMQDALATSAFPVVVPHGLPSGARLLSIQRMGDPETGRPSVVFHYALGAKPFDVLESGWRSNGAATTNQVIRASSSTVSEPGNASAKVVAPAVTFRAGGTQIIVSVVSGALADAQIAAIRTAMTAAPMQKKR